MGVAVPDFEEQPELPYHLEWIWSAYVDLGQARTSSGFGVNPLAVSEIVAWLDLQGLTDTQARQEAYQLIRRLDARYMEWQGEQAKGRQTRSKTGSSRPARRSAPR